MDRVDRGGKEAPTKEDHRDQRQQADLEDQWTLR